MQIGSCIVRLGGDLGNSVFKQGVTPAEIVVLQSIHGADAVLDIKQTGNDRRAHGEELQRLVERYGRAKNDKEESIVSKIWPSPIGLKLPVNFKDVGIDIMGDDEPKKGGAPAAPASAEDGYVAGEE